MNQSWITWVFLAATAVATGCGGGGRNGGPGPSDMRCNAGSTGTVPCAYGSSTCNPGQFCADNAFCDDGCTSDVNCSAGEQCVREAGEAVGACAPCAPVMMVSDAGQMMPNDLVTRCQQALRDAFDCSLIDNAMLAEGQVGCREQLNDSQREALATCVEAARDCDEINNCLGGGSSGGCQEDDECVTTPGISHQICSGGLCTFGCRLDADCGNDYACEPFSKTCVPAGF